MSTPEPFDPASLTGDPEIAALLTFPPVVRKCIRRDGWWPEHQYRFIVGVAETGNPDKVAHALGQREDPEKLAAILALPELELAPEELAGWERAAADGEPADEEKGE